MKIKEVFEETLRKGKRVIIPYITGGFPDPCTFLELLECLEEAGAGMIEVGVPFSDPVADGPVIQESSQKALEMGMGLKKILALLIQNRHRVNIPLVLMGYYNPFFQMGMDELMRLAKEADIKGFIVPDLPIEEAKDWTNKLKKENIDTIFLVAPTTSMERARVIASFTTGFLYCISVTGVTGAREKLPEYLKDYLESLRKVTSLPRAVGFGISSPQQVREISPYAEGIVVGSALIKLIMETEKKEIYRRVRDFISSLVEASHV